MFDRNFVGALAAIWLAAIASSAQAATHTVTTLDDAGAGSLRAAIAQAISGDTIVFDTSLEGTVLLDSALPALDFDLTIEGPGADVIGVSGEGVTRVFFIDLEATVTISGVTIVGGFEEFSFGGGLWNLGNLTIQDCVIRDNFAGVSGGGISNEGTLTLVRTTVSSNAVDEFGVGGGIENFEGTATIVDSAIAGNAADFGGGIENAVDSEQGVATLTVTNSTISANNASEFGGGIDNFGGNAQVLFSTVVDNAAPSGGGILNDGQFSVKNSLVANNPVGGQCDGSGTLSAPGDNLATDNSCPGFTEVTAGAIELGPLTDNGGPTATHALGESSVAINAAADCTDIASTTDIDNDQRGVTRPQGSACDIGAFELIGPGELIFIDGFEDP